MIFKKIKYLFIFILIFYCLASITLAANLKDAFDIDAGATLDKTGRYAGYFSGKAEIDPIISIIIQATLSLLGIIFIILIIYGGGLWMTAKGNEQQVDKAKDLITAAIIGLVIVVAAYAISYFVIQTIGKGSLKNL